MGHDRGASVVVRPLGSRRQPGRACTGRCTATPTAPSGRPARTTRTQVALGRLDGLRPSSSAQVVEGEDGVLLLEALAVLDVTCSMRAWRANPLRSRKFCALLIACPGRASAPARAQLPRWSAPPTPRRRPRPAPRSSPRPPASARPTPRASGEAPTLATSRMPPAIIAATFIFLLTRASFRIGPRRFQRPRLLRLDDPGRSRSRSSPHVPRWYAEPRNLRLSPSRVWICALFSRGSTAGVPARNATTPASTVATPISLSARSSSRCCSLPTMGEGSSVSPPRPPCRFPPGQRGGKLAGQWRAKPPGTASRSHARTASGRGRDLWRQAGSRGFRRRVSCRLARLCKPEVTGSIPVRSISRSRGESRTSARSAGQRSHDASPVLDNRQTC